MPLLNLEGWATNTKSQRDLKQTMQTVIATNAINILNNRQIMSTTGGLF